MRARVGYRLSRLSVLYQTQLVRRSSKRSSGRVLELFRLSTSRSVSSPRTSSSPPSRPAPPRPRQLTPTHFAPTQIFKAFLFAPASENSRPLGSPESLAGWVSTLTKMDGVKGVEKDQVVSVN